MHQASCFRLPPGSHIIYSYNHHLPGKGTSGCGRVVKWLPNEGAYWVTNTAGADVLVYSVEIMSARIIPGEIHVQ